MSKKPNHTDSMAAPAIVTPPASRGGFFATARDTFQILTQKEQKKVEEHPLVLPASLRAVRLEGGEEAVGFELGGTWLVPAWVKSVGDLVVSDVRKPSAEVPYIPKEWLALLVAAMPKHEAPTEITPEVRAACIVEARAAVEAERDYFIRRGFDMSDRASEVLAEFFRSIAQKFGLGDAAIGVFSPAWLAGYAWPGASFVRKQKLPQNFAEACRVAASTVLYEPTDMLRIKARVEAEQKSVTRAKDNEQREVERKNVTRTTTPRAAGLIIARRLATAVDLNPPPLTVFAPGERVRDGYVYRAWPRIFPASITVAPIFPMRIVAQEGLLGMDSRAWEIIGDEDTIELDVGTEERAPRMPIPVWIFQAIRQARAIAIGETKRPEAFLDLRAGSVTRARLRAYREYLRNEAACVFDGERSAETINWMRGVVLQVGVLGLGLSPNLVAVELAKRGVKDDAWSQETLERARDGFGIADSPHTHMFAFGEAAQETE